MLLSPEVLHLSRVDKAYGAKTVLAEISFHLNRGERTALVGENGAGKTTLARLILGQEKPDSGMIRVSEGVQIGYLPQEVTTTPQTTIRDYLAEATGAIEALRLRLNELEEQMEKPLEADTLTAVLEDYGEVQAAFEAAGGYDLEYRLEQVMSHLQIDYLPPDRELTSLSGGEKTRVVLAGLLLRAPDLLILDEPTNHLDVDAIEWLEKYLLDYPHALLLISHDRRFLNEVVTQIIELSPQTHTATLYNGNYDAYRAQQEHQFSEQEALFWSQRAEIKRLKGYMREKAFAGKKAPPPKDNDKFIPQKKGAQAEQTASKQIRDAKVRLERLEAEKVTHPTRVWRIGFQFDPLPLPSMEPIRLSGVSKSYGERLILAGLSASLPKGERVILVAPNGTGKTTLLKLIMGELQPDAGLVHLAPSVKVGYLDQEGETLDPSQTVLEAYRTYQTGTEQELLAELHHQGLFSADLLDNKRVGDLSVGQQRKFQFACLIASQANVLLLDEPTNHLDVRSLEALEEGLLAFEGAILAVSHDRWFVERIATRLWYLEVGQIREEMVNPSAIRISS